MKEEIQMRNLKRALSLALASVMLLGMMVIGASAVSISDFTDQDEIVNKEAVALLVDLGIVNGKSDTNFGATDTLERTALAKMVYIALTGTDDASMYADMNVFSDVTAANCWAAGFINYCYSVDVLSGVGGDRFSPYSSLTVAQTAKALLVALGYIPDAEISMYEGNDWAINVMRDAQANRLLDGIGQSAHSPITRDNAARMIFNALKAEMVTPEYQYDMGTQYVTKYNGRGVTLGQSTFGLVSTSALVTGIDTNGNAVLDPVAVGSVSVTNRLPATADMVGSTVNLYFKGTLKADGTINTTTQLYNTALVPASSNTVATINGLPKTNVLGSTTGNDALTALLVTASTRVATLESGKNISNLKIFYNGAQDATKVSQIGKLGVIVELKDTNDVAGVDTVVITEKTAATLSNAPTVSTNNGKTTVTIPEIGIANKDAAKVVGYENLVKGDVVLYINLGGVTYIEKASSITGSVTGNNTGKGALINGTYYQASELGGKSYSNSDIKNTATYNFFLDNGGYIIAAVKVSEGTGTTNLAVVDQVAWVKPTSDGSIGSQQSAYMQAKLVFTDGTSQIVTIASVDGIVPTASGAAASTLGTYVQESSSYDNAKNWTNLTASNASTLTAGKFYLVSNVSSTGAISGRYFAASATTDLATLITENQFYNYSVNSSGAYVLTSLNANTQGANTAVSGVITANKPNFTGSLIGNANTVFIYATADNAGNYTYTVYTGIANVPTTAQSVTGYAIVNAGVTTYVFADLGRGSTVSESADLVYILSSDYTAVTGESSYLYDVLLNGEKTTLKLDANTYTAGNVHKVKSISDKDVYALEAAESTITGIKSVAGGVLVLDDGGSGEVFNYDAGTIAYVVDGQNVTVTTIENLALDANDTVYVAKSADGAYADLVYVTKVSQEPTTVTLAGGSTNVATVAVGDLRASGTNKTGSVTGWVSGSKDTVKISVATPTTGTTVDRISINGTEVQVNADYTLATAGTYTVVVTVKDNNSQALATFSYTFTVTAP